MKIVTVEEEYEKNRSIKPEDIKLLLSWIDEQKHLPKITELEALIFLSCHHGNQADAKNKIEIYYSGRTRLPEFFQNRNPECLTDLDVVMFAPLDLPREFHRTIFCRMHDSQPSRLNIEEQVKIVGMVCDLWILKEGTAPAYQFIVDGTGIQLGHALKVKLATFKNAIFVLQETLPVVVMHIHVINVSSLIEKMFNMAKPLIKNHLLGKIIFHTDGIESLYPYIPKEYLPQNLGGNGPTYDELHSKMKNTLTENIQYFKEEELTKRTDESRRMKKENTSNWKNMFSLKNLA